MSEADRAKWDTRYREGSYEARTWPSPFLETWLGRPPRTPGARALDVACGAGRNALRLAEAGYRVDGVDISAAALARAAETAAQRGLAVRWIDADLDTWQPEAGAYALVSVIRYMNRALHRRLPGALAPGGWLVFEHHFQTTEAVDGPRGDAFRLAPGELLGAFEGLRVVHHDESIREDPDGRRMALARLVAVREA